MLHVNREQLFGFPTGGWIYVSYTKQFSFCTNRWRGLREFLYAESGRATWHETRIHHLNTSHHSGIDVPIRHNLLPCYLCCFIGNTFSFKGIFKIISRDLGMWTSYDTISIYGTKLVVQESLEKQHNRLMFTSSIYTYNVRRISNWRLLM